MFKINIKLLILSCKPRWCIQLYLCT